MKSPLYLAMEGLVIVVASTASLVALLYWALS
jgi:hypothetical protein